MKKLIVCILLIAAAVKIYPSAESVYVNGFEKVCYGMEYTRELLGEDVDEDMYPYYSVLNERQREVYVRVLKYAKDGNKEAFALHIPITKDEMDEVRQAVERDHPELIAYEGIRYSERNDWIIKVSCSFNELADNLDEHMDEIYDATEDVIAHARSLGTDMEKITYLHDYVCSHMVYTFSTYNQTCYDGLVNGIGVCASYARSMQYLMQQCGIPAWYMIGQVNGSDGYHGWLIVEADGSFYLADPTFDDSDYGYSQDYLFREWNMDDRTFDELSDKAGERLCLT